jgi:cyclic-di-GMP phosphodiesterase, flagellum assembly factor TipF
VQIGAIFIALCIVLIAASLGAVLFLRFGFSAADSALAVLGLLTVVALYNAVAGRRRDRAVVSDQVASLARGSGDLARQMAEFGRRLLALEEKVGTLGILGSRGSAAAEAQPLAGEIEELSRLVRQLADSVAQHELALNAERAPPPMQASIVEKPAPGAFRQGGEVAPAPGAGVPTLPKIAAFRGLDQDAVVAAVAGAIDSQRVDLYLQPIARFVKAPAALLLNRVGSASANIHPADFSDFLGRFGIDLIADRIESESTVVDLLDYDVRFGQGFLFSPPRPVRAEALQGVADAGRGEQARGETAAGASSVNTGSSLRSSGLAQLVRAASGRT